MDVTLHGAGSIMSDGTSSSPLAIHGGRIAATPSRGAFRIDLHDHLVFPGLVNAHDHLQANAIPSLPQSAPFANSYAWIDAFQAHFDTPAVKAALAVPKRLRLRHGGLKNLLAGTTCVAHHDPWHPALDEADFPVALLRDFGWSYTFAGPDYGPPVRPSFDATLPDRPWLIHLAEGTDEVARGELAQLAAMGCLAANTVLIHGVGLTDADIDRVIAQGAAVVWCPGSNHALLGRTLDPRRLFAAGRLALGSDSRLSGERDLLEELRVVATRDELPTPDLLALATTHAARILRLPGHGQLAAGSAADLVIVEHRSDDEADSLVGIDRSRLRAVIHDGVPRIADADFAPWFDAAGIATVRVTLDGRPKLLAATLADPDLIALEPGLELLPVVPTKAGTLRDTTTARC